MKFNGQALQDKFVLNVLGFKKEGYFVEIGSKYPIKVNNTYILEHNFDWTGIMIEWDNIWKKEYDIHRKNSIHVMKDATKIDYKELFENNNVPLNIDYLQIDLDVENGSTLSTLLKMNNEVMDKYKFATITFEHDLYGDEKINHETRNKSREIFKEKGYVLVFPDVQLPSNTFYKGKRCGPFEDWYVHPDLVDMNYVNTLITSESLFFKDIVYSNKKKKDNFKQKLLKLKSLKNTT